MAFTTANMGLKVWDQVTDPFNHTELAINWDKIDNHDHTGGVKGIPITANALANNAVTTDKILNSGVSTVKIANSAVTDMKLATPGNAMWRTAMSGQGQFSGAIAIGKFYLNQAGAFIASGAQSTPPPVFFPLDYGQGWSGLNNEWRCVTAISIGSTTPTGMGIFAGLFPVSAMTGVAAGWTVTIGGYVTGSGGFGAGTMVANTYTKNIGSGNSFAYSDALPYCFGIETSGVSPPAGTAVHISYQLQFRST
jgi:hypothetical protein